VGDRDCTKSDAIKHISDAALQDLINYLQSVSYELSVASIRTKIRGGKDLPGDSIFEEELAMERMK